MTEPGDGSAPPQPTQPWSGPAGYLEAPGDRVAEGWAAPAEAPRDGVAEGWGAPAEAPRDHAAEGMAAPIPAAPAAPGGLLAPGMPGPPLDVPPPPPPPGPGVHPPFPVPPTDKGWRGLIIGLVAGSLALVLCCAGGIVGFGVLIYAGASEAESGARKTVVTYLDALIAQDYPQAYAQLCDELQARQTLRQFAAENSDGPQPMTYNIDGVELDDPVRIGATVNFSDGANRQLVFTAKQQSSGAFKICDISG